MIGPGSKRPVRKPRTACGITRRPPNAALVAFAAALAARLGARPAPSWGAC